MLCPRAVSAQTVGINITNGIANIFWPQTEYYYLLQSTTNLSASNTWNTAAAAARVSTLFAGQNIPTPTNFSSQNITWSQPATNGSQFYRVGRPLFVPLFSFAIFYDGLLEFSDSATMVINGAFHANGPIYTGATLGASQNFSSTVTTASTITSPANAGFASSEWTGPVNFNGQPPFVTNVPAFISPLGTNNPHIMIEMPSATENPESNIGQWRYYNMASVVLIVTNTPGATNPTVFAILQSSYNGANPGGDVTKFIFVLANVTPIYLNTNPILELPFLSLTNTFCDQREASTNMFVTQVDVGRYAIWLETNEIALEKFSDQAATILYVADRRNIGTNKLAVIRLVNGSTLPYNGDVGFTVATPNPLYIEGNYNTTVTGVPGNSLLLGSTTNGASVPAALAADAITILSTNWSDAASGMSFAARASPANTTINAALLTGNVPSTGTNSTNFSGGIQNLPRFLENWNGFTLVLNTSFVCLYSSQMATNQFQLPGVYYYPPTRVWGLDVNFLNPSKLPPGTPLYELP